MICEFCGNKTKIMDSVYKDFLLNKEIGKNDIIFCPKCEIGKTYPILTSTELNQFYEPQYAKSLLRNSLLAKLQNLKYERDLHRIKKVVELTDNSILDLGAGQGDFVSFLRAKGYKTDGLEMSSTERDICYEKHNIRLHSGNLDENLNVGIYDLYIFRHVLEHLVNPTRILKSIQKVNAQKLTYLVIFVPNLESAERRFFRNYWHGYDIPRHRWHFNRKSIQRILKENGFEVLHIYGDSNGLDFIRSLDNFLNSKFRNLFIRKLSSITFRVVKLVAFLPIIFIFNIISPARIMVIAINHNINT